MGVASVGATPRAVRGIACGALAALVAAAAASRPASADAAILVGGGHSAHRSEAQIELNAGWIREVLERAGLSVTLHYTDGDAPGADVMTFLGPDAPASPLEPLARAFGDLRAERTRWRNHDLDRVAGPTTREALEPALVDAFARARTRTASR